MRKNTVEDTEKKTLLELFKALKSRRMVTVLFLGFSSGLPLLLLASNLKIWLRREGIELDTIGYISWVMVPYSLNFLWAPLLDRFIPSSLGRRRSWILLAQLGLISCFVGLGFTDPKLTIELLVALAIGVAFFAATQDIAIDAYRRETLNDEEQGLGASFAVYGYRLGMFVAAGPALGLVGTDGTGLSFNQMFVLMAAIMLVGVATTFLCSEPEMKHQLPASFKQSVVDPFVEFFGRDGALAVLLFVVLFKVGDAFAGSITGAYYVDLGFTNAQIAAAAKTVGFFSTMAGLFLGGALIYSLGILRALLLFACLQAFSTAAFSILTSVGPNWWALAGIVALEDLSSGMGTAALVAFISLLANRKYTATQYALLSSLSTLGRTFLSGFAGNAAEALGYTWFYIAGGLMAIPGIILLLILKPSYATALREPPPQSEGG
jgi:PAT family beta-lactamase induction signal transducer AmpG